MITLKGKQQVVTTIFNVHPAEEAVNNTSRVHEGRDGQDEVAPVGQEDEPLDLLFRVIPRPLPAVHPSKYDPDHVVHGPKQAPYQVGWGTSTVLKLTENTRFINLHVCVVLLLNKAYLYSQVFVYCFLHIKLFRNLVLKI